MHATQPRKREYFPPLPRTMLYATLTAALGTMSIIPKGVTQDLSGQPLEASEGQPGKLVRVTLFRDQALVTRRIAIPPGAPTSEITVGRLPQRVIADSIYAEGSESLEVRSVRVTQRAVSDVGQGEMRELQQQAKLLQREHQQKSVALAVLKKEIDYIDQLMRFTLDATHADINQGVLDSNALVELTDYAMEKQSELHALQTTAEQELADLAQRESELEQRAQLLTQPADRHFEVRLVVANREVAQAGQVELSYLVGGCRWSPQYTIRGAIGQPTFQLRYSALVEQMSGEDWTDVQLTLSTASPSMGAAGPSLTPFRVAVRAGSPQQPNQMEDLFGDVPSENLFGGTAQALQERTKNLRMRQQAVANEYAGKHSQVDNLTRDYALNAVASEVQNLELAANAKQLKTLADDADDEVASQTYQIAQQVSLDSRREQQLVSIIDTQLTGSLYHVATPLLSSFAYREAEMVNDQAVGLLRGPADVYLDGRFVGKTELPSIASGQHLVVGFGADNQVRTRRELMEKEDQVQGGNRRLTFRYRLVVANFKSTPVQLRLFDRLPAANQAAEVSVQPLEFQFPLSDDGLYARVQKPRGILRWDLEVPGEQFGEDAFDVAYGYTVEFDRNRTLSAIIREDQIADDYQEVAPGAGMGGMGGGMGGMGGMGGGMGPGR